MKTITHAQNGQALVTLLFFVAISTIVTSAAIVILYDNSLNASRFAEGTQGYYTAESGVENALLRIIRNPNYTGETLSLPEGDVEIAVVHNSGTYTITSTSTVGDVVREVEATAEYLNTILTVTSWREIY